MVPESSSGAKRRVLPWVLRARCRNCRLPLARALKRKLAP
jgi:hypothetical protein